MIDQVLLPVSRNKDHNLQISTTLLVLQGIGSGLAILTICESLTNVLQLLRV